MKVLITGANGFSAHYLAKALRTATEGYELYFTSLTPGISQEFENCFPCDLNDLKAVESLIETIRPDQIYHLAGRFTNDYASNYRANVLTTKNILDSLLASKITCRILLIGSAAEYGAVDPKDNPIHESHPLRPVTVYGLTKVYQSHLMDYYCLAHGLDIVLARTFNLLGKGMSNHLFVGRVYEQIDKYKRGEILRITVGNLSNKRDYIDIEDAVKHYQAIMAYGTTNEIYNVGSGKPTTIANLLIHLLEEAGLDQNIIEETVHRANSKVDVVNVYANINKIKAMEAACPKPMLI